MCDGRSWCGAKADFIAAAESHAQWAGFAFETGPLLQSVAGVYVYGRRDGERVRAVHVGEADDITLAMAALAEADAPQIAGSDCFYWLSQPDARLRAHIVRVIAERYHPTATSPSEAVASHKSAGISATQH